ncbi:outer membrane beta-barrel protein [Chryseobacterium sp. C-71]|uniref:TonB-dependent receptor domain-containing protein n=1 Tax=Chryseobacterium sp. C-71 TaxID=2893882 RepID=UPI001E58BE85|nr:TonB-dependent receptor [Chryseobacterium sp. C-71]UFH30297.1 outer membrane beta-barrel protein [Chryseobacterium sp. C-71]
MEDGVLNSMFSFSNCSHTEKVSLKNGMYKIYISKENYQTVIKEITISENEKKIDLNINLESIKSIEEVTLSGVKKRFIKSEADKITILVDGNNILSNGSTYEALTKIPGVIVTPNGYIAQNGKISAIYIDGEPSSISGEDLNNYLNSLPANSIDKIELIYSPGAKYSANVSGGIINIITKSKNTRGINGSINTINTVNHNYKNATSLQLNGKYDAISWQFLAGYYYNEGDQKIDVKSIYNLQNSTPILNQETKNLFLYRGSYARTGLKYTFKDKSSINLNYNFWINGHNPSSSMNIFSEDYIPAINNLSLSNTHTENSSNELILKYKQNLDSIGNNFQLTAYGQIFNSEYFGNTQQLGFTNLYSINQSDKKVQNYYVKNDWEFKIKKFDLSMYLGGRYGDFQAERLGKYNLNNPDSLIFENTNFNSEIPFNYNEKNLAAYVSFNKKIKKFELSGGLRMEYYDIRSKSNPNEYTVKTNYIKFFPNLNAFYRINSDINLSLNYSKKINQPNYNDLDPNINNFNNSYFQTVGNPFLNPELVDNYQAKLSAFDYAYLSYGYSFEKSKNLTIIENDGVNLQSIQTLKSFDNVKTYSLNLGLPLPFALFTKGISFLKNGNINPDKVSFLFANVGYNKTVFNNSFILVPSNKATWNFYGYSQIVLPKNFKFNVYYSYMSKGVYNIYDIRKPVQSLELTLSNKFFNNSFNCIFSVQNALNNSGLNAILYNQNLTTLYNRVDEKRMYRLSLTYTFGKYKTAKNDSVDISTETKSVDSNKSIGK